MVKEAESEKLVLSPDSTVNDEVAGFRTVFKNATIFGGVQVYNIIITLIRGKLLAILIGTAGMGLNGLLMSGLNLVNRVSGLGLSDSAVRDISAAYNSGDEQRIRRVYTVFNRWIWLTAAIGLVLTICLAPMLSRFAFKDESKSVAFMILSVTFVFGALTGGVYTLLRGLQRIKSLAWANIYGSTAGLLVTVPIFYFYRIDGVVPAIIAASAVTYIVSVYFKNKVNIKSSRVTLRETYLEGKQMAALGITLSLGALLSAGVKFVLSAYVSKTGSLNELGIYNAGQSIMEGYVGMVFSAMGVDYYPRLCAVIDKPDDWKKVVNQQIETVLLILGPILSFILLSAPLLVRLLLSVEFLPALGFIFWATLAVIIKGIVWASGFVIIAKANKKLFLYVQLAGAFWFLPLNFWLFNLAGTTGLGIALVIDNLLAAVLMYIVLKVQYAFVLSKAAYRITFRYLILLGIAIAIIAAIDFPRAYIFCGIIFMIASYISFKGLNERMDLVTAVRKFMRKKS
jgi:O-antigen/teichoic acid export membrane protein